MQVPSGPPSFGISNDEARGDGFTTDTGETRRAVAGPDLWDEAEAGGARVYDPQKRRRSTAICHAGDLSSFNASAARGKLPAPFQADATERQGHPLSTSVSGIGIVSVLQFSQGVLSAVRRQRLERGGRRCESCRPDHFESLSGFQTGFPIPSVAQQQSTRPITGRPRSVTARKDHPVFPPWMGLSRTDEPSGGSSAPPNAGTRRPVRGGAIYPRVAEAD